MQGTSFWLIDMRTEIYDSLYYSGAFERWLDNPPEAIKEYLEKEIEYLLENISSNSVVLDVGCGFGRHMKILAPKVRKVVGIDYNRHMIARAQEELRAHRNSELYLENAREMHFENYTFDFVICMLNTFGDLGGFKIPVLKEMERVTKTGGKITISVWSENALEDRIEAYERAGMDIEEIRDQNISLKESHTSEVFSRKQLTETFNQVYLNPRIIELCRLAYLAEATK
jgi:SAM-dependent methyltransferase